MAKYVYRVSSIEAFVEAGLFSKAERALQIAGWSEKARGDIEIFRVVDDEGLTPLLMVLNDADAPAAEKADLPRG